MNKYSYKNNTEYRKSNQLVKVSSKKPHHSVEETWGWVSPGKWCWGEALVTRTTS